MVYLLSQDHSRRERLEAEVDALDIKTIPPENWYDKLPYSAACFEEAMRLFPPAPFIALGSTLGICPREISSRTPTQN